MLNTKYLIASIAVAAVFFSCKKSTSYDVVGDPGVKFFINITSPGNAPQNSLNYNVVNIPNSAGSGLLNLSFTLPAAIRFPVYASLPTSQDVTINAALDTTLIAPYNAAHNTTYKAFPAGILHTDTTLAAHIMNGSTASYDSITITTDPTKLNLMTDTVYMAPIKLTTISPKLGVITSQPTTQVTYVVVKVEQRRIKYLGTTTDIVGTLITPRTGWSIILTPTPTTVGSIVDGSATTYSRWAASPGQIDVNLQAAKNISAIRLYTNSSTTYVPTEADVYLSTDGVNFDHIGSPLKANMTFASTYNYIVFYKPITAQYIRLVLSYSTSTSTNNFRVTELDAYAQ
ncbi:MAG TPA: discoidin domain-containing protein [Chitinophagaceae bacterium]|jgi:hypothetical protein